MGGPTSTFIQTKTPFPGFSLVPRGFFVLVSILDTAGGGESRIDSEFRKDIAVEDEPSGKNQNDQRNSFHVPFPFFFSFNGPNVRLKLTIFFRVTAKDAAEFSSQESE